MAIQEKISIIGGGNMAEALVRGFLRNQTIPPGQILISEPKKERGEFLSQEYHLSVTPDNKVAARFGEVIILAIKPQIMKEVLEEISSEVNPKQVIISIAAGISISFIASYLSNDYKIIRVMPNAPAQIGEGVIALCGGEKVTPSDLQLAQELFTAIGKTIVTPESYMDAVTGLSGSGPAYVFLIIEALTDGGVKMGLPRDIAQFLVLQTIIGAARMVLETGEHPGQLKDRVTSPAGTTIAGLQVLEEKGVRGAFINAVVAATERSRELSRSI